ncbi:SH3 domain-containing protein [Streptomyces sp. NBC_01275]|uniref:SH3 domain-containing protein n=1 Tax=Streptomyces sp. NBC_01275 TaxID=2903807 RepID=UPI0022523213|nr:SH3 domain-containing protein [Streptomyces sp. NBC_01275]MCX4764951.1 SH3 domain-containing protein [Streptomyces sp. NBC_01275]
MSLRRSALTRLAIATAIGALAATAVVTPAAADGGDDDGGGFDVATGGPHDWQGGGDGNGQGGGDGNSQGGGDGNGQGGGDWQDGGDSQSGDGGNWQNGGGDDNWQDGGGNRPGNGNGNDPRRYRGRVTASELLLRSKPTRASQVIRVVHRGQIVSIFCKTSGQNVQGNALWYLLTDGTWAWGSARYIDNIGAAPRWC